jgi:hypothetical protein
VLAVAWPDIPAAVGGLPHWDGRVVIDTTFADEMLRECSGYEPQKRNRPDQVPARGF